MTKLTVEEYKAEKKRLKKAGDEEGMEKLWRDQVAAYTVQLPPDGIFSVSRCDFMAEDTDGASRLWYQFDLQKCSDPSISVRTLFDEIKRVREINPGVEIHVKDGDNLLLI